MACFGRLKYQLYYLQINTVPSAPQQLLQQRRALTSHSLRVMRARVRPAVVVAAGVACSERQRGGSEQVQWSADGRALQDGHGDVFNAP